MVQKQYLLEPESNVIGITLNYWISAGYSCILLELLIFNKVLIYNNCILVVLVNVKWIIDNGENECYDNDDSKNNRLAPTLK